MKFNRFHCWIILLFSFYSLLPAGLAQFPPEEEDFGSVFDDTFLDSGPPEAVPTCDKDQFQCQKSLECIEKHRFCDYVVDCQDSSDEITCGDLDFTARKYSKLTSMTVSHNKIFNL